MFVENTSVMRYNLYKKEVNKMRMYDIICDKKAKKALTREQIEFWINGATDASIPDYQTSALLMAIYFNGMDKRETSDLTDCMARSGDMIKLDAIEGFKVDKHSTGGVGDKTTLIAVPIVASCGVKVAKMSGRGLGFTGGTIDKLESIPGFDTSIASERFFGIVRDVGAAVVGQTGNLAPADKKLYALRDVTATVDNISLIAASIMSKKLASGADGIVLDVKTGSGAFMKTLEGSVELAKAMVSIGGHTGRRVVALVTDMDRPLGCAIGNSMEVIEAAEVLKGGGPDDLKEVSMRLAANMLYLAGKGDIDCCLQMAEQAVSSGAALKALCSMVKAQGGDERYIEDTSLFPTAKYSLDIKADEDGFVTHMDTEEIGNVSVLLGAGRETKDSPIDYSAGMLLYKKTGDKVRRGDTLAVLYSEREHRLVECAARFKAALTIGDSAPDIKKEILARVTEDGVEYY